jgi:transcription initiation factor TFIID subunit 12
MSDRDPLHRLVDAKLDVARESTISDLLHKIDPSASIDPLAEELVLDIADDFIDSIVSLAAESARIRGSQTPQAS